MELMSVGESAHVIQSLRGLSKSPPRFKKKRKKVKGHRNCSFYHAKGSLAGPHPQDDGHPYQGSIPCHTYVSQAGFFRAFAAISFPTGWGGSTPPEYLKLMIITWSVCA